MVSRYFAVRWRRVAVYNIESSVCRKCCALRLNQGLFSRHQHPKYAGRAPELEPFESMSRHVAETTKHARIRSYSIPSRYLNLDEVGRSFPTHLELVEKLAKTRGTRHQTLQGKPILGWQWCYLNSVVFFPMSLFLF